MLRADKVGMHVHDVAVTDKADGLVAAGHNKLVVFDMKG